MPEKELGKKIGDKIILPVPFNFSVSITAMGLRLLRWEHYSQVRLHKG